MNKEITIVVAGKTGNGKTTVAQIISKALSAHGIKARVFDDEVMSEKNFDARAKAVAEKTEVIVKTVQVHRDLTPVTEQR